MANKTTDQQHADQFVRWFSTSGHWVYEYRAEALRVWRERGIVGRPTYTPGAGALLEAWAASDPLPALVAKWQAEQVAA